VKFGNFVTNQVYIFNNKNTHTKISLRSSSLSSLSFKFTDVPRNIFPHFTNQNALKLRIKQLPALVYARISLWPNSEHVKRFWITFLLLLLFIILSVLIFCIDVKQNCLKQLWFLAIHWIINASTKSEDGCESKMVSPCFHSLSRSFPNASLHAIFALYELRTFQLNVRKTTHGI
jgi:hypothetical protein